MQKDQTLPVNFFHVFRVTISAIFLNMLSHLNLDSFLFNFVQKFWIFIVQLLALYSSPNRVDLFYCWDLFGQVFKVLLDFFLYFLPLIRNAIEHLEVFSNILSGVLCKIQLPILQFLPWLHVMHTNQFQRNYHFWHATLFVFISHRKSESKLNYFFFIFLWEIATNWKKNHCNILKH